MSEVRLWIRSLAILLILLASAEAIPVARQIRVPCVKSKMETFVKSLVANATIKLPNPILLPRLSEFVILTDGTIDGLSTLKPNHTTFDCNKEMAEISSELYVNTIEGKYRWQRELLTRTLEGTVNVKANAFKAFIRIRQELGESNSNSTPLIQTCTVTELEDFDYALTGEEYITWPREKITGPAKVAFENAVKDAVSNVFREALASQLEGVIIALSGKSSSKV